jgi:hypothetical protein
MTSVSRLPNHARPAGLLLVAALALAGCGGGTTRAHSPAASSPSSPGAPSSPSTTGTPSDSSSGSPALSDGKPSSPAFQVVKVAKFGLSFELPKHWTALGSDGVLGPDSPAVKLLARRLGQSPDDVVRQLRTAVQTMAVSDQGAEGGFLENVVSTGVDQAGLTDDQLKLQLATVGARLTSLRHVTSPVGEITRVAYTLAISGKQFAGVVLAVSTGEQVALVTVSSHDAASAARRADQVQASLKLLPGGTGTLS